jgi:hypothetical protein
MRGGVTSHPNCFRSGWFIAVPIKRDKVIETRIHFKSPEIQQNK